MFAEPSLLWTYGAGGIWSFFMGAVLGNLVTNPIYRLPRGMHITKEKPFCDHCHTPLTPRDLFPIFSWLIARGKCRTCKVAVPSAYFWIELGFALLHLISYVVLGFSENYLLVTTAVGALFASAAMVRLSEFRSWRMLMLALIPSLLWAALRDHSLSSILNGLLYTAPLFLFGVYLQQEKSRPDLASPLLRHGLALWVLGMWAGSFSALIPGLIIYLAVYCGLGFIGKPRVKKREFAAMMGLALAIFFLGISAGRLTEKQGSGIVMAVPHDSHIL